MTKTARSWSKIRVIFAACFLILSSRDSSALFEPTSTIIEELNGQVTQFSAATEKVLLACGAVSSGSAQSQISNTQSELSGVIAQAKAAEAIGLKGTAVTAGADAGSATGIDGAAIASSTTGAGIGAAGSACTGAVGKINAMQEAVHVQVEAQVILGQANTTVAVNCNKEAPIFKTSYLALTKASESTLKRCSNDAAGGGLFSGITGSSMAKTALAIGAAGAVGAGITAAVMSGKGGKKGGGDSTSTPNNVDVPTPTGNTVACGPGQYQVSPGVCAFGNGGGATITENAKTASANAGNAESLAVADDSGIIVPGAAGGASPALMSGASAGGSGGGSSSGDPASGSTMKSDGAKSLGASPVYGGAVGSYGGGYSSADANAQNVAAAVVTEVFIDGIDDRGSYIYKLLNGKRVKVYVNCKTRSRCKIRNELKQKIEADPLLQ